MKLKLSILLLFFSLFLRDVSAQSGIERSVTLNANTLIYDKQTGKRLDAKYVMERLKPDNPGILIPRIDEYGQIVSFSFDTTKINIHLDDWDTTYKPRIGEIFPPFFMHSILGDSLSLSSQPGKIIVLNFMLLLRKPFYDETNFLKFKKMMDENTRSLNLYPIILTQSDEAAAAEWSKSLALTYPVVADARNFCFRYAIMSMPCFLIIGKDHRLKAWVELEELSEALAGVKQ